jgi:hypothetical protein
MEPLIVGPPVYRTATVLHGRRQSNEEHRNEQIIIGADAMQKGLIEFAHENARLETLYV